MVFGLGRYSSPVGVPLLHVAMQIRLYHHLTEVRALRFPRAYGVLPFGIVVAPSRYAIALLRVSVLSFNRPSARLQL